MLCVDLKERFGDRYRIAYDPAAALERGGKSNPWYYIIRCKFGEVHPYGGQMLAFHCRGSKMRGIIKREFPDFEIQSWTDDEEAVFLFHVDRFPELAKIIRPRRSRKLSEEHRRKLTGAGIRALQKRRSSVQIEAKTEAVEKHHSSILNGGTSVRDETSAGRRADMP